MRLMVMVIMLLILTGIFVNTGRQIYRWLTMLCGGINGTFFGIFFGAAVLAVLAVFVVSRRPGMGDYRRIFRLDHYALGLLCYVVLIVNAVSLLLSAGKLIRLIPSPLPRAVSLAAGTVSLAVTVALTAYGVVHAGDIQVKRYHVSLGQKQDGEASLRIALLSDIHLGYMIEQEHLAKVVARVNGLRPDLVCIAGDLFDGDMTALADPEELQALLGSLEAPYGVYACLGNHDAGPTCEEMLDFLEGAGIRVLLDEAVVIDRRLVLAGRRDSSPIGTQGESRSKIEGLPESAGLPVIVLDHQPGNIGEYGSDVDLILCGHTHRGQMFPFEWITNALFDVDYGYYRAGKNAPQVIVTSGAGTWGPPLRVGTDNEVVEITVDVQTSVHRTDGITP